jgi:hypothetical protein
MEYTLWFSFYKFYSLLLPHCRTVLFNAGKELVVIREVSNSVVTPTLFQSVLASNHVFLHFRFLSLAVIVVYYFSYDEVARVCIQLMK